MSYLAYTFGQATMAIRQRKGRKKRKKKTNFTSSNEDKKTRSVTMTTHQTTAVLLISMLLNVRPALSHSRARCLYAKSFQHRLRAAARALRFLLVRPSRRLHKPLPRRKGAKSGGISARNEPKMKVKVALNVMSANGT